MIWAALILAISPHDLSAVIKSGGFEMESSKVRRLATAITTASVESGVPEDLLIATVEVESGYTVSAKSHMACVGLLQLHPITAKAVATSLGMGYYDSGRIEHNIRIGARYLADLHKRFGKWTHALTAYNKGPTRFVAQKKEVSGYAHKVVSTRKKITAIRARLHAEKCMKTCHASKKKTDYTKIAKESKAN
jgi:soluble lytic murein transglycosylase-like protein